MFLTLRYRSAMARGSLLPGDPGPRPRAAAASLHSSTSSAALLTARPTARSVSISLSPASLLAAPPSSCLRGANCSAKAVAAMAEAAGLSIVLWCRAW